MRRFLSAGVILLLSFGVALSGQDSSNLYDRMGVITERGLHGAVPEENIDLFSGGLTLKNLDITLPGPNGFDLNIWRVYNSKIDTDYSAGSYAYPQQEHTSWVGFGWMMHMGRIFNPDSNNPTIQFPDGRTEGTYQWMHDANILITRNFLQLKKYNQAYGGHHTLHFQDGTVWVFGVGTTILFPGQYVPIKMVTKIINSYGHEINIEYYSGTDKLKQITDALGRVVSFYLDGEIGYGNLDYIRVPHGNGYVTYDYHVSKMDPDVIITRLDWLKPPALNQVSYSYNTSKELSQITTSYGGTITYTFADWEFKYVDDFLRTRVVASKTIQFSADKTSTWNYFYGDYRGMYYYLDITLEDQTVKRLNAGYTQVSGPEFIEESWFYGPQPESEWYWLSGTLAMKRTIGGSPLAVIADNWYNKVPEQISNEHIIAKSRDWGPAKAALEVGGYQTKIGTAIQYTQINYDDAEARKYGLPSGIVVAAPYDPYAAQGSLQRSAALKASAQASNQLFVLTGTVVAVKSGAKKNAPTLKSDAAAVKTGAAAAMKSSAMGSGTALYVKYRKHLYYAFSGNSDFTARNMLSLLAQEVYIDPLDQEQMGWGTYKSTQWEYFSNGAIQKIRRWKVGGELLEWNHTYEEVNSPSEIKITIDPPGMAGIETYTYKNGTLARVAKPGYVELDRDIYADGLIFKETNQHGGTMTFTYDDIGRITHIDMPYGFNYINASWSQNNVEITRGNGNYYSLTKYWDGMGRNLGFEESGFQTKLYSRRELDGEGRVIAESKGAINANNKTVFELNANGQPLQVTDPTGKWTKFAYVDNTCTITDMKNNQKVLTYAHLPGLVTSVVQGDTRTDSFYRGENRLCMVESSSPSQGSRYQAYTQNGLDQLTYEYHPETDRIDYLYNAEGNLETKTWSDTTTTYTYNTANQLLSETDGDETISFIYDTNGRVKEVNTSTSLWRRYDITYNALGAVTSEKQAVNGISTDKTVTYGYNGFGLLDELTYPDGRKAVYSYSSQLLPVSMDFNNDTNRISDVYYGVNKQPTDYKLANGAVFSASYDAAGRIYNSNLKKVRNTLFNATYGYDNVGNIASLTKTTPAGNASFAYDIFNRLTKATYPEKIFDYTYDPFGNMLTAEENSVKVFDKTYTGANRVSGLSYDGRGNLTQGEGLIQVWDKRNRMKESRTATNALLSSYVYNERGLRLKAERFGQQSTVQVVRPNGGESLYLGALDTISWTSMEVSGYLKLELLINDTVAGTIADNVPAAQTSYLWPVGKTLAGWVNPGADYKVRISSIVPPSPPSTTYYFYDSGGRLLSEYDQSGTCVKDYLYLGGKMIGEFQPSGSKYYYYASDQINSTRLVTDASGAVVHSAQYDPYGGLYKTWVDTYNPKPGFSGKERESGSDYDYFGARYYGHRQYRFLSVDPVINKDEAFINPQLWNLYSYCHNNPITFLDPDGDKEIHVLLGFRASEMGGRWSQVNQLQKNNLSRLAAQLGHSLTFGTLSKQSLNNALGTEGGWTFVITHGIKNPVINLRTSITMSNKEQVSAFFRTNNEYVGFFTCSSSDFAGGIFGNAAALSVFSVDSGKNGKSKAYGLWLGAIGVVDALLRGSNPQEAADAGSTQLGITDSNDHVDVIDRKKKE